MKTIRWAVFCIGILISSLCASAASSTGSTEGNRDKWELGIGIGFNIHFLSSTYNHTYSPLFYYIWAFDSISNASQVLDITNKNDIGLSVMVNYMITKKLGIQLLGEFHKNTLKGRDNFYSTYLEYLYSPYPLITPFYVVRGENIDWAAETDGHLTRYTLGLNVVTRFYWGHGLNVDLSGGPGFFMFNGEVSPLGYTYYYSDRISWYKNLFQLKASIKPTIRLGLNIGAELNVSLLRRVIFFFSCRYFFCPMASSEIYINEVLSSWIPGSGSQQEFIEKITSIMSLRTLKINPSFLSLSTGFKLRF
ncbi:MAG: hypothetical protein GTO45_38515 [Candidatus Aminicenantes bacterium]|nr:hypothetical protein [Candidatus Aminicenantes bacterium]NIM84513.1 hypothetical protein [Candidatus Aminicenantes bacterium]NIN24038.1 hypothetical protein [Candidatus Aminicenantes bacterium]NIN47748.1 hypothetical protein [Candidatus Aminicenantes bacterium]NIN90682.1 hypothetical protein [Candidatus Aminicenantes bacterium]